MSCLPNSSAARSHCSPRRLIKKSRRPGEQRHNSLEKRDTLHSSCILNFSRCFASVQLQKSRGQHGLRGAETTALARGKIPGNLYPTGRCGVHANRTPVPNRFSEVADAQRTAFRKRFRNPKSALQRIDAQQTIDGRKRCCQVLGATPEPTDRDLLPSPATTPKKRICASVRTAVRTPLLPSRTVRIYCIAQDLTLFLIPAERYMMLFINKEASSPWLEHCEASDGRKAPSSEA
jgi:hypothetical protein